jgi:flagellar motor component MotA
MDWSHILQVVLEAVCAIAIPFLVKFLIDWLKAKSKSLLQELDMETREALYEAVRIAVTSAEQSGLAGLIERSAEAKKRYACAFAEKYLAQWGIGIDLDVIADMIEAEVKRQFPHE